MENGQLLQNQTNDIKSLIYTIREKQVMLDSDIANLYEVETKRINESVKKNTRRFPEEFCFILNEEEYIFLRPQFATTSETSEYKYRNKKYLPFT